MSPRIGSQFSFFGEKQSPYRSTTSGASATSDRVARSRVRRSMFTWVVTTSEMASTIQRTGSIMPCA